MTTFERDLLTAARIIVYQGLADAFAHLSIRLPDGEQMLFMPAKSPALLQKEELFTIGIEEEARQASVHQAVYCHRPDAGAVVHTHSPNVICLSVLGQTVEPIHNYSAIFYEGVPFCDRVGHMRYGGGAAEIARTLGGRKAVIQKGHGAVTVGSNIQEACLLAIFLEESADYLMAALSCGEPQRLSWDEAQRVAGETFGPRSVTRAWEHFSSLALREFPL